eukprot:scaffold62906_cov57-Phaeocystis_antarctica.AAC.1
MSASLTISNLSPGNIVFNTRQRTAINFPGPSAPIFGVVCASSAIWLFPFACEVFVLSNYGNFSIF